MLVGKIKLTFLYFKQSYTYFNTLFHLNVYKKYSNNITQILLPNRRVLQNAYRFEEVSPFKIKYKEM